LKSPLIFILLLAFFITVLLQEYIDAGVILLALSISVIIGIIQEGKASQAFKKLADSQVHTTVVLRNGAKTEIKASEVVVGDIIIIRAGQRIPADIRIIEAKDLSINEASLTGESKA